MARKKKTPSAQDRARGVASLAEAFVDFASHLSLVLFFVALPLAAGGLLHFALNRAFSSHARHSQ